MTGVPYVTSLLPLLPYHLKHELRRILALHIKHRYNFKVNVNRHKISLSTIFLYGKKLLIF